MAQTLLHVIFCRGAHPCTWAQEGITQGKGPLQLRCLFPRKQMPSPSTVLRGRLKRTKESREALFSGKIQKMTSADNLKVVLQAMQAHEALTQTVLAGAQAGCQEQGRDPGAYS